MNCILFEKRFNSVVSQERDVEPAGRVVRNIVKALSEMEVTER